MPTYGWGTPGNIGANDGAATAATIIGDGLQTNVLDATDFSAALPTDDSEGVVEIG